MKRLEAGFLRTRTRTSKSKKMIMMILRTIGILGLFAAVAQADGLRVVQDGDAQTISVFREGGAEAILVQAARADHRPYLHPMVAPDGNGILTEYSPGHHLHQTGIYWGFTRINGRDYFHHPAEGYCCLLYTSDAADE